MIKAIELDNCQYQKTNFLISRHIIGKKACFTSYPWQMYWFSNLVLLRMWWNKFTYGNRWCSHRIDVWSAVVIPVRRQKDPTAHPSDLGLKRQWKIRRVLRASDRPTTVPSWAVPHGFFPASHPWSFHSSHVTPQSLPMGSTGLLLAASHTHALGHDIMGDYLSVPSRENWPSYLRPVLVN